MILLDPQLKKEYVAKLIREGKNDGMITTGAGLVEVTQAAGEKIAVKVTLDKKAKAVICFDFETLKNNIAKSFGIDIKDYEIIFIDGEDELATESQTDFEDSLAMIGDQKRYVAKIVPRQ